MARLNLTTTVLACVAAVALAGCGDDAGDPATAPSVALSSTPTPSSTPAEPSSPIAGAWLSRLTVPEVTRHLKRAGLGKWTEKFLANEEIVGSQTIVYTFTDKTFSVAYLYPDGTWKVGWKGPLTMRGKDVLLDDDFSDTVDTYAWNVEGDQLTLSDGRHETEALDGIPLEVFDAAYLTEPMVRTDCQMNLGEDC